MIDIYLSLRNVQDKNMTCQNLEVIKEELTILCG